MTQMFNLILAGGLAWSYFKVSSDTEIWILMLAGSLLSVIAGFGEVSQGALFQRGRGGETLKMLCETASVVIIGYLWYAHGWIFGILSFFWFWNTMFTLGTAIFFMGSPSERKKAEAAAEFADNNREAIAAEAARLRQYRHQGYRV